MQGDAPYRATPDDLSNWFVRGANGQMAPFSAFARTRWSTTPTTLSRFQGYPSFQFEGQAVPGQSSGAAMDRIDVSAVRGEWDAWPNDADYRQLLEALHQAPERRYVVIPRGTHVMHLEAARFRLYEEVEGFLNAPRKIQLMP